MEEEDIPKTCAHSFTEKIADAEHYVRGSGSDCLTPYRYYYDCAYCDEWSFEHTWVSSEYGGHDWDEESHCSVCDTTFYHVNVGECDITTQNATDVFGDGKVSYDKTTNTLTLNGYTYSGDGTSFSEDEYAAIVCDEGINIRLVGENTIETTEGMNAGGIVVLEGDCTISGTGTLTVLADGGGIAVAGGSITVKSGKLVFGTGLRPVLTGIMGLGVNIEDGDISIIGSACGIYSMVPAMGIIIKGGNVSIATTTEGGAYEVLDSLTYEPIPCVPDTTEYENCKVMASVNITGSDAVEYNPEDIGSYKYVDISLLGHIHSKIEIEEQASTCMTQGWDAYKKCECGQLFDTDDNEIDAIPYRNLAECDYDTGTWGYKAGEGHAHICKVEGCGKKDEVMPHTPNIPEATEEAEQVCIECGYIMEPALDHIHNISKVDAKKATHEAAGNIEYYYCDRCGKYYKDEAATQEITAADIVIDREMHNYGSVYQKDESYHWKECECGEKMESSVHTYDSGEITRIPTETEAGVKTYTCTVCGATKEEVVPATGKEDNKPEDEKREDGKTEEQVQKPDTDQGKEQAPVQETTKAPQGSTITDENGTDYKVTKSDDKDGTVTYTKPNSDISGSVIIPDTVTIDGITYKITAIEENAFKNNKKITKVTIGNNIVSIGKNAFSGCSKLKTLKLGASVTTIGDKAFYKCTALTKVTIPAKVSQIGKSAFYGCKKLKNITFKTTKLTSKKVGSKAFKGTPKKAVVKVPKKALKAYKKFLVKKGISKKAKIK